MSSSAYNSFKVEYFGKVRLLNDHIKLYLVPCANVSSGSTCCRETMGWSMYGAIGVPSR